MFDNMTTIKVREWEPVGKECNIFLLRVWVERDESQVSAILSRAVWVRCCARSGKGLSPSLMTIVCISLESSGSLVYMKRRAAIVQSTS